MKLDFIDRITGMAFGLYLVFAFIYGVDMFIEERVPSIKGMFGLLLSTIASGFLCMMIAIASMKD